MFDNIGSKFILDALKGVIFLSFLRGHVRYVLNDSKNNKGCRLLSCGTPETAGKNIGLVT